VLLRSLEPYREIIRRIFSRYEIPFFLDHRDCVAHHPLAELTRCALRLEAFGWDHNDWFGALKTGLTNGDDDGIDWLENEALARGWRGRSFWQEPIQISGASESSAALERVRVNVVPPFLRFAETMAATQRSPTGTQLAAAFRELWRALPVDRKLARWSSMPDEPGFEEKPAIHETVREQMNEWLRNLELAFATEALPLNVWLPILEAGLASLSVGVIPPALDQVLVGAIDRSRNPDLQLALVLGVNEGVFPAPPPAPALLNRLDREQLAAQNTPLGPDFHQQIGLERYYGYIACTRARRQLVLTWAHQDADGRELNPSPFVHDLRKLFPKLPIEEFSADPDWTQAEHWTELIPFVLRDCPGPARAPLLAAVPQLEPVIAKWKQVADCGMNEALPPGLVEKVYGRELRTSVSGLEDFAACPFKFFAGRGLRAEERVEFEIDPREKGSFQHEVLREFHLRLERDGRRWRDLSPAEARVRVREMGEALMPGFRDGLFLASPARRFTARLLIEGLERLLETLVAWAKQYQFDPAAVETGFGLSDSRLPAWRIDLDEQHALLLRGRIDRIDLCRIAATDEALAVVIDYKSSARELDPTLLHHGLELQLFAYLGALAQLRDFDDKRNLSRLIPAGAFYVALRSSGRSIGTRDEGRDGSTNTRASAFQHRGRFNGDHLGEFDNRGETKGDQFRYAKNKDGSFSARGNEALPSGDFRALVARVEDFLRRFGREIYAGKVEVSPFRWKSKTACDFCLYRPVCRFDPWTQPYRVLRAQAKDETTPPSRRGAARKAIA
jgi:ATP-dependent helicase/nuclease subunit B